MAKLILYSSIHCPHCVNFKKRWEKIKEKINIPTEEIDIDKSENMGLMEKNKINGVPTLQLVVDKHSYIYNGKREINDIINFVSEKIKNKTQSGGSVDYERKYLKYKTKYIALKNLMGN